jgi:uncharacterized spore protein YtfJ
MHLSVKGYRQNELFVSAWIDMIIDHACRSSTGVSIHAEDALLVLLDNNVQLLDEVVTPAIIQKFVALVQQQVRRVTCCAA